MATKYEASPEEKKMLRKKLFNEKIDEPLEYVGHDTTAHVDPDMQELKAIYGMAGQGYFWQLAEILGSKKGHIIDLNRKGALIQLTHDMEFDKPQIDVETGEVTYPANPIEKCRQFIETLVELNLLNAESYRESNHIVSRRIARNAELRADKYAANSLKGAITQYQNQQAKRLEECK